jgi:hypothetical protein
MLFKLVKSGEAVRPGSFNFGYKINRLDQPYAQPGQTHQIHCRYRPAI